MAKVCRVEGEAAKVSVRHARKAAMDAAKALASEDERKRAEREVQKLTDAYIEQVRGGAGNCLPAGASGGRGEVRGRPGCSAQPCAAVRHPSFQPPPFIPRCRQVEDLVARKEQSIKAHDS